MLVHVSPVDFHVILEDQGAFVEFLKPTTHDGQVDVRYYPRGGDIPDTAGAPAAIDARGCLATFIIVVVPPVQSVGLEGYDVEQIEEVVFFDLYAKHLPFARTPLHPCYYLRKRLVSGSFFYSKSFDLTSRFSLRLKQQQQLSAACTPQSRSDASTSASPISDALPYSPEFTWNHFLQEPLRLFRDTLDSQEQAEWDARYFQMPVIQGFFEDAELQLDGQKIMLTIVSRRGWGRDGTRMAKRGIDDLGNVGNFVETETILQTDSKVISFAQVRGSIPLKWEERLHMKRGIDVTVDQPLEAVSLAPFTVHMLSLLKSYKAVHILSLLSNATTGPLAEEGQLCAAYEQLCKTASAHNPKIAKGVAYEHYEVNHEELVSDEMMRLPEELGEDVKATIDAFGATVATCDESSGKWNLDTEQQGVFRVNCRDCLDRTTLGEFSISRELLATQMKAIGLPAFEGSPVEKAHRELWAANGDAISFTYAGSQAMNSTFIRTDTWSMKQNIENAANSEKRREQYFLYDKRKNRAVEILTGQRVASGKQPKPPVLVRIDKDGKPVISSTFPTPVSATPTTAAVSSTPNVLTPPSKKATPGEELVSGPDALQGLSGPVASLLSPFTRPNSPIKVFRLRPATAAA
ncbi:hypothetical protein JCM11641_003786 [Rhodosporidiobolus odoratus]